VYKVGDRPLRLTCVPCDSELKKSFLNTTRPHADELDGLGGVEITCPAKAGTVLDGDMNAVTDMRTKISIRGEHNTCNIPQAYRGFVSQFSYDLV